MTTITATTAAPGGEVAPWTGLLPALLDDDPDELLVTDTLLDRVDLAVELAGLVDGLAELLEHATAAATRRAYESDLAHFTGWAARYGLTAVPAEPQTVALYLAAHENSLRPATLVRRLSAIAVAHRTAGRPTPTGHELVRRAVAAVRRKYGTRPSAKAALVTAQLGVICTRLHAVTLPSAGRDELPARRRAQHARVAAATTLRARRDRALLLVGYAAALRRSELVGLDVGDLREDAAGLVVFVARSKTDQEGLGDFVGIAHGHPPDTCTATCPIRAWREWQVALTTAAGGELPENSPAFRPITRHGRLGTPTDGGDRHARLTGQSVALIVKQAVALLEDPNRFPPARYAGHSLRAGFATQAAAAGVPLDRIMRQTRHSSVAVALRYLREGDLWRNNPSAALGL
jgi:integrase